MSTYKSDKMTNLACSIPASYQLRTCSVPTPCIFPRYRSGENRELLETGRGFDQNKR